MSKKNQARVYYRKLDWDQIFERYEHEMSSKRPGRPISINELFEETGGGCRRQFGIHFSREAKARGIRVRTREEMAGMPAGSYTRTGQNRTKVA